MARVLGIGVGLFVLAFFWALAVIVALLLSRAKGAASYGSFGVIAAVGLLTVILVFIPREPQSPDEDEDAFKIYDYTIVYRTCLLVACALCLIGGFVVYVIGHLPNPYEPNL
ncbi:transmembrane protein 218-like [Liolophura sinensis]|uniref:transmembrane protein 218-like n=1 Tax=Liolophura sinensis TaxID=3198878 RepID=UPI003159190D